MPAAAPAAAPVPTAAGPRVIAVVGPTATGKSELGMAVAEAVGGEVVNADSMQLYRGMDIGTAKLTPDRRRVPHHLLDVLDVTEPSTAAIYQARCRAVLDELLARGVTPVLVGGSGLYVRAALDKLDFPGTDPAVRGQLEERLAERGAPALHAELAALAPEAAARMEPGNGRRVVRALEVLTLTGSMPGAMTSYDGCYDAEYVGLDRPDLAERIESRVEQMLADGLEEEVRRLDAAGLRAGVTASRALGYAQVLAAWDRGLPAAAVKGEIAHATRRFARRQRAWFRRDPRIRWLDAEQRLLEQVLTRP